MKTIVEMLTEEIQRSDDFKRKNFGQEMGEDFPDLARELMANEKFAIKTFAGWAMSAIGGVDISRRLLPHLAKGPVACLAEFPEIAMSDLRMLYWGIQIGRKLEREVNATLAALSDEGKA